MFMRAELLILADARYGSATREAGGIHVAIISVWP
jgi:hypothetical protein